MAKFFFNKNSSGKDWLYWLIGILLFVIIMVYIIYSIRFLTKKVRETYSGDLLMGGQVIDFNLDGVKQIKE